MSILNAQEIKTEAIFFNPDPECTCNGAIVLGGRAITPAPLSRQVVSIVSPQGRQVASTKYTSSSFSFKPHTFSNLCGGPYGWAITVNKTTTFGHTTVIGTKKGLFDLTGGTPPTDVFIGGNTSSREIPYATGAEVILTANAVGSDLTFSWLGPLGQTIQGSPATFLATSLTNGTWTLTATNNVPCSATATTDVFVCSLALTNVSATCGGAVTASGTGALPPSVTIFAGTENLGTLSVNAQGEFSGTLPTTITPGVYTATAQTSPSCISNSLNLQVPPTLTPLSQTICEGGTFVLTATPGLGTYSFFRGTILQQEGPSNVFKVTNAPISDSAFYSVTTTGCPNLSNEVHVNVVPCVACKTCS